MKIGILRETKTPVDVRVPLSPKQCRLIEDEYPGTRIFVQPGNERCFADKEYEMENIVVKQDLNDCDILMGVKEVAPQQLIPGKTYFFFSHTIKKQSHNKGLLRAVLNKHIRLVDYETLTDSKGIRIIGFGRWAGLIGTYNAIRALCIRNQIPGLPPPQECHGLSDLMKYAAAVHLPVIRIALTGDGRVAGGAEEMLNAFGIRKVIVEQYLQDTVLDAPLYVQLDPEKYNKHKSGKPFELSHFFTHPQEYESDFMRYSSKTDLLIMAAYWDPKAPVLYTAEQMAQSNFKIRVVGDITCDLNGSVPSTIRATTFPEPYYDFNPVTCREEKAFSNSGNITVMSIDNLPCGLPVESSVDFGHILIKNILDLLLNTDHEGIIARATIAENGKLTQRYEYLHDWVYE